MAEFRYRFETHGERLYGFVRNWMSAPLPREGLEKWLEAGGMSEHWIEYLEQMVTVALTGRIVAAGRSLKKLHKHDRGLYRREYRSYLNDYLLISKHDLDELIGFALPSAEVAEGDISDGLRKDRRAWAAERHRNCYLCNVEMDFVDKEADNYCTLEHLWPSSYGGDSIEENLLPACAICNRVRKSNFATWAVTSVQSVLKGIKPALNDPKLLTGPTQFALHHWAGQRYAIRNNTNLRDAFRKLGPWVTPRIKDTNDIGHFFNLQNHGTHVVIR